MCAITTQPGCWGGRQFRYRARLPPRSGNRGGPRGREQLEDREAIMTETYTRREVLQAGTLAAVAAGNALAQQLKPGEPKIIRIGIVGTGGRGTELLRNLVRLRSEEHTS